jgi:DNA polymerase IV
MPDQRKIIHIDMDAFFASVEQRDFPELKGKPVAVGGGEQRGVVAAASYEARRFGVRSAMASKTAKRLCPSLIFTKPRFEVYKEVSGQIREIFAEYTTLIEPLSLDEAYLDVTENFKNMEIATEIAAEIREKIFKKTGLTASAGISYNKFLAKTASDINKPNGQCVIKPSQAEAFVLTLPIHKFYGIGKVTAEKMQGLGIQSGKELREQSLVFLTRNFGKIGQYFYDISRAIDHRAVEPHREMKSISVENTYHEDLKTIEAIQTAIEDLIPTLLKRIEKYNAKGKTLTLKIKFADFEQITRSKTTEEIFNSDKNIGFVLDQMLQNLQPFETGIRLLGIGVSNFKEVIEGLPKQLKLEF